VGKNSEIDLT
jgi:hypothetical protein